MMQAEEFTLQLYLVQQHESSSMPLPMGITGNQCSSAKQVQMEKLAPLVQ